jgi:hypothetical protein
MKHILKFIVGFSVVMACLLLFVVVVNYGWFVFYTVAFVLAIIICYKIGNDIWDEVGEAYDDWNTR